MIVESLSWLKTFINQLRGEQIIFWSPNLFTLFHCGLVRACPERHAWPGPVWLGLGCYCLWMSKLNIGSNTLGHVEEVFCTNSYFYSITLSVSPVSTVSEQREWKSEKSRLKQFHSFNHPSACMNLKLLHFFSLINPENKFIKLEFFLQYKNF